MSFLGLNDDGTPMDDAEEGSQTLTPTLTPILTWKQFAAMRTGEVARVVEMG